MTVALVVFFVSLALITLLFALRIIEESRGERFARRSRILADNAALNLKDAIEHGRENLEKLPPEVAHVSMRTLHRGAIGIAALASTLEEQAHRFADFVASKRNFQRRETKSEFLKGVSDFRNTGEVEDVEENQNS